MKVPCDSSTINDALGTTNKSSDRFQLWMKFKLDAHKEWLAPLILNASPSKIVKGKSIEKKYMNIVDHYWFGFISTSMMSF